MLDESIPLTTSEFEEWGNPAEDEFYYYLLKYSPYDNIKKMDYPAMYVTTAYHDSQVQYWEPLKYVAKMREYKTDDNAFIFDCNMNAGHGGDLEEHPLRKEIAKVYAFIWVLKISLSSCIVFWVLDHSLRMNLQPLQAIKTKGVYTDLGYNTSPFRINYPFNENADFLRYKNNFKTFMGIGFAYKWFHLRIGFPVFGFVKPVDRWGESQQFQIGFNFRLKKFFF